jgi:hypothetical protein
MLSEESLAKEREAFHQLRVSLKKTDFWPPFDVTDVSTITSFFGQ